MFRKSLAKIVSRVSGSKIIYPRIIFSRTAYVPPEAVLTSWQLRDLKCALTNGVNGPSKMADERHGTFATPALKRPRLDDVANCQNSTAPMQVECDAESRRDSLDSPNAIFEVSSESDPQNDDSGGDSGFHEILPRISTHHPSSNIQAQVNSFAHKETSEKENCSNMQELDDSHHCSSFSNCFQALSEQQQPLNNLDDLPSSVGVIDEDADEVASTISDISGLSDISDLSGQEWKPIAGPVSWVQRQINSGADPRDVIKELVPDGTLIPNHIDEITLWKIIVNILSEPPRRKKLSNINTLDDVVGLLRKSKNIIVLTGAGVSVSSGIPDFRSRNGIYARLSKDFPDLPDPQAMFDIHYFRKDPRPFFKFAKEIYPGQFQPSISHHFIKLLEDQNKLLRNYSQNIDTLEKAAGIEKVITCHGSFATASCTCCRLKVDCSVIKDEIFDQRIPGCPICPEDEDMAVMKPDIVFFGEGLSEEFHQTMGQDKDTCDLLIVMGSSLKVRPVALIPSSIPSSVPQILINREPLKHLNFDVELLGDCDVIIEEICKRFCSDWSHLSSPSISLQEIESLPARGVKRGADSDQPSTEPSLQIGSSTDVAEDLAPLQNGSSGTDKEEGSSCDCSQFADIRLDDSSTSEADTQSEGELADLRATWRKTNCSLAARLPGGSYFYEYPSRYIFTGAEVYSEDDPLNTSLDNSDSEAGTSSLESKASSSTSEEAKDVISHCDIRLVDSQSIAIQNGECT